MELISEEPTCRWCNSEDKAHNPDIALKRLGVLGVPITNVGLAGRHPLKTVLRFIDLSYPAIKIKGMSNESNLRPKDRVTY